MLVVPAECNTYNHDKCKEGCGLSNSRGNSLPYIANAQTVNDVNLYYYDLYYIDIYFTQTQV